MCWDWRSGAVTTYMHTLLHNYTSYQAVIYPQARRPLPPLVRTSPRRCFASFPLSRRPLSSGLQSLTFIGSGAAGIDGNSSCISCSECICGRRLSSCGWSLFCRDEHRQCAVNGRVTALSTINIFRPQHRRRSWSSISVFASE